MRKRPHRIVWFVIMCLIPFLAACEEVTTEPTSQSAPQGETVLNVPTRTLAPIVSLTPRFTATPIPSITYTPSNTSVPTATTVPPTRTPTPTPSATPTVEGRIRSTENVNLREGPGTNYEIVLSVPPGTTLGVLGRQTDARGHDWYKVAYIDDDGELQNLWVFATLVDTDFIEVVGQGAATLPAPDSGAALTPTPRSEHVDILAYCRQKGVRPPRPTTNDNVYVEWSWYVARPEYMDEHLANATYDVALDGERLDDWSQYATEIKLEEGVWIIYWYYPVGKLSTGEHTIDFELTWDQTITDGYKDFGPGTANVTDTGDCTFTVVES